MEMLETYFAVLESPQLMEDKPPERSRRSTRVATFITIPIVIASLAFAQVAAPAEAGVGAVQILVFILLLGLSGLMSASETALTAIGSWKVRELRDSGAPSAHAFSVLERHPTRFITTLLIANNVVNIAFTALVTQVSLQVTLARGGGESLAVTIATAVTTILILVFGEITPKSIAVHHPVAVSRLVILPVYYLSAVVYPLGIGFTWLTGQVLKLLKLQPTADTIMSPDELRMMLRSAEEVGALEAQEQEMIRGVIDLEETVVREVMTPRVDVIAAKAQASLGDLQVLVTEHGYSRLPVYGENIDDIKGVVYARDLLPYLGEAQAINGTTAEDIMRSAQFVPETLSILSLLRDMRMRKNHVAIVVDEFGGMAGVVTLEDIIEEITGEIYDETDDDEVEEIVDLGDGTYQLQGTANMENVADALGIGFDDDGDYDTVAGFLIGELDRIPQPGESVTVEGVTFTVQSGDERRVQTVLASPEAEETEPPVEGAQPTEKELPTEEGPGMAAAPGAEA